MSITEAVQTLEHERSRIGSRLNGVTLAIQALSHSISKPKRVMSASARRRIALGQKARWAKWHRQQKRAA